MSPPVPLRALLRLYSFGFSGCWPWGSKLLQRLWLNRKGQLPPKPTPSQFFVLSTGVLLLYIFFISSLFTLKSIYLWISLFMFSHWSNSLCWFLMLSFFSQYIKKCSKVSISQLLSWYFSSPSLRNLFLEYRCSIMWGLSSLRVIPHLSNHFSSFMLCL